MAEVILFLILLIAIVIILIIEIILGIKWLIKRYRKTVTTKQGIRLKKNTLLLLVLFIAIGGLTMFSQLTTSTPKIVGNDGNVLTGSIAELRQVEFNGRDQWISIRGVNKQNPVLLFLAGGPGGSQMAAVRHELQELEKHFVVVNWDQPGSAKSYKAGGNNLTVDSYLDDGNALTKYLCKEFKQDKIYLLGESWGSALGIFLAAKNPNDYHAFIGTGQMVAFLETENLDYDKAMEIAKEKGDTKLIKKLEENGRPPYYGSDVTWKSADYLTYLTNYMNKDPNIQNRGYSTFRDIFSPEYGIIDKINYLRGIVTTFNHVYPKLYDIDLRKEYSKLEVPVYFLLGRHDINAPTALVDDYFSILEAPSKQIIWFEHSGHSPWINEADKFIEQVIHISKNH